MEKTITTYSNKNRVGAIDSDTTQLFVFCLYPNYCHRAFILLPGKKKEQASEEACSLLVGEAGLEPARPQ